MSEAVQMGEWDRIAWVCMMMPRFSDTPASFEVCHPFRNEVGTSDTWDGKTTDLVKLQDGLDYWKERLPEKLTPEEHEAAYQRFRRWQDQKEEDAKLSIV